MCVQRRNVMSGLFREQNQWKRKMSRLVDHVNREGINNKRGDSLCSTVVCISCLTVCNRQLTLIPPRNKHQTDERDEKRHHISLVD